MYRMVNWLGNGSWTIAQVTDLFMTGYNSEDGTMTSLDGYGSY